MIDCILENNEKKNVSSCDYDSIISCSLDDEIDIENPFLLNEFKPKEMEDNNEDQIRYFIQDKDKKESDKSITKNYDSSTKTGTKTKIKPLIRKNEKIFHIKKVNKKLGRLSNANRHKKHFIKHNEYSEDNVVQKIKVRFYDHICNCINRQYELYLETNDINAKEKTIKLIQRISPKAYKTIKRDSILTWFSSKIKDIISAELSSKYRKADINSNKKRIKALYLKNEAKNVIVILEKTVREMLYIYCNNIYIEGFKTLKDDLNDLREKMIGRNEDEIQEYLSIFQETSIYLENIFLKKKSRQKNVKKILKYI